MAHDSDELTRVHLSITERQKQWAENNHINLSSKVRELLREEIDQ